MNIHRHEAEGKSSKMVGRETDERLVQTKLEHDEF